MCKIEQSVCKIEQSVCKIVDRERKRDGDRDRGGEGVNVATRLRAQSSPIFATSLEIWQRSDVL